MTVFEIMKRCTTHIAATLGDGKWPEDDWISLGQYWDANIFLDKDGIPCISIYPVIVGQTITSVEPIQIL